MSTTSDEMWVGASTDHEAQEHAQRLTAARVAAHEIIAALARVGSKSEHVHRKALYSDRLDAICATLVEAVDFAVLRSDLEASLDHDFDLMEKAAADEPRSLSEIAVEIRRDWGSKVNFGAVPYLDAMRGLDKITDSYGAESAASIVSYFISNSGTWRGETAKRVKAELKAMLKQVYGSKQADLAYVGDSGWDEIPVEATLGGGTDLRRYLSYNQREYVLHVYDAGTSSDSGIAGPGRTWEIETGSAIGSTKSVASGHSPSESQAKSDAEQALVALTGQGVQQSLFASKTASDHKCARCGKDATHYSWETGSRAAGTFSCDEHADLLAEPNHDNIERIASKTALTIGEMDGRSYEATCPNESCSAYGVAFVHDDLSGTNENDDEVAECPECETPLVWDGRTASKQAGMMEDIRDNDPDGGSTQPTDEDYRSFEQWIVDTYGKDALRRYRGWGNQEEDRYRPFEEDEGLSLSSGGSKKTAGAAGYYVTQRGTGVQSGGPFETKDEAQKDADRQNTEHSTNEYLPAWQGGDEGKVEPGVKRAGLDEAKCSTCDHAIHQQDGTWVHEDGSATCPNGTDKASPKTAGYGDRFAGDPRWITAKYPGQCRRCHASIPAGRPAWYWPSIKVNGMECDSEDCGKASSKRFLSEIGEFTGSLTFHGVSLTRVRLHEDNLIGVPAHDGHLFRGVDPSGKEVVFKTTKEDAQQIIDVMIGDLAGNFSGVSIEDSDIVSQGSVGDWARSIGIKPLLDERTAAWGRGFDAGRLHALDQPESWVNTREAGHIGDPEREGFIAGWQYQHTAADALPQFQKKKEEDPKAPDPTDAGTEDPAEAKPEEASAPPEGLDPAEMQPGQEVGIHYTLTGEAQGEGETVATLESFDQATGKAVFNCETGRFAVTLGTGGSWVDAAGTQFSFSPQGAPAEEAPVPPGNPNDPAAEQPPAEEDPAKKKPPFQSSRGRPPFVREATLTKLLSAAETVMSTRGFVNVDEEGNIVDTKWGYTNEDGKPVDGSTEYATENVVGKGMILDLQTANLIIQACEIMSTEAKSKAENLTVSRIVDLLWRAVGRSQGSLQVEAWKQGDNVEEIATGKQGYIWYKSGGDIEVRFTDRTTGYFPNGKGLRKPKPQPWTGDSYDPSMWNDMGKGSSLIEAARCERCMGRGTVLSLKSGSKECPECHGKGKTANIFSTDNPFLNDDVGGGQEQDDVAPDAAPAAGPTPTSDDSTGRPVTTKPRQVPSAAPPAPGEMQQGFA